MGTANAVEMIREGRQFVSLLDHVNALDPDRAFNDWHNGQLQSLHDEYRDLYHKQRQLLDTGVFFQQLAAELARLPAVRELFVTDTYFFSGMEYIAHGSDDERPCQVMMKPEQDIWAGIRRVALRPQTGRDLSARGKPGNWQHNIGADNRFMAALTGVVRCIGTQLKGLVIAVSHLAAQDGRVFPTPEEQQQFSSGMLQLERFRLDFTPGSDPGVDTMELLTEFLSACLGEIPRLRDLDLRICNNGEEQLFLDLRADLGVIMGTRRHGRLESIHLSGALDIPFSTLESLLSHTSVPMSFICLDQVRLLRGTWKAALDLLRGVDCKWKALVYPWGAEHERMSGDNYVKVFVGVEQGVLSEWDPGRSSAAGYYIKRRRGKNPIQAIEDGDFDEIYGGDDNDSDPEGSLEANRGW
ncbi:hypothetical protein B0T16DRAFT_151088 [Cercophora newfieldiana]|uniref:Uncharacterized protein n=1 Tax=Cercophora newfieldiana TaxID=92897 RepID=A0AA40CQM4_9PEZI|nr:hypothetical protein B0T16DRAFT_151088 [Cercophora newfieldiana]